MTFILAYTSLIYYILISFPSLLFCQSLPNTSTLLQIHCSSISLQKRAELPGMSTNHGITSYHNTKHKPLLRLVEAAWRRKFSEADKRVRNHLQSQCYESHKNTKLLPQFLITLPGTVLGRWATKKYMKERE